ncbi:hypothetical protein K8T06_06015 [bacterium]|nr:hypothetical protein [bacterium]
MRKTGLVCLSFLIMLISVTADAAIKQLANDVYEVGDEANYQAGFVAGEIMAAKFSVEPNEYPFDLISVQVLLGDGSPGGTTQGSFLVHIWEDAGGESPGVELIDPFSVVLTAGYINDINLTGMAIPAISQDAVRIGLEFLQDPPPSFLSDDDGFITQHANSLFSIDFGWHYAEFFGLTGDWILRLTVDTAEPAPTHTPTGIQPTFTPQQTYTPLPTYTPYPTPTPPSTQTPYPTYTPYQTYTPAPTWTTPPTYTPYPTCQPEIPSMELWMPAHHFTPNSPFLLNAILTNPDDPLSDTRFVCVLLMAGGAWYYPQWQQSFDSYPMDLPHGEIIVEIIQEFPWPTGTGSYDNIMFVAAVTELDNFNILIQPNIWIWSFSE